MKRKNPIALFGAWLALAFGPNDAAFAATGGSGGTITGRVQNVVTGQYLNKARVVVKGTDIVAFTDESGIYRIPGVRSGPAVLEVFYTDLDVQELKLDVPSGGSVEQNVSLTNAARYGQDPSVVKLDAYVVATNKEIDAESLAINEQRFAPNIKNVMSTDSLGVIMVGAVGEFLKFIPGLTAEYDNADVLSMNVRGIGGDMTAFSTDGSPMVNTASASTRRVQVRSLSLNDISRVEITKVPTPSMPADSLAGSVNLIRKSAFERSTPEFRYSVILVGTSEDMTFSERPRSNGDKKVHKVMPGFDFIYALPIGKNFGVVVAGSHGNKFNEQHISRNTFNTNAAGTGASITAPFLQSHLLFDGPRNQVNNTLSLKADWRVTPHSVLSVGGLYNPQKTILGNLQLTSNAGTNPVPVPATGVPFRYGSDFTVGATGRGGITNANINRVNAGTLTTGDIKYRYDDGTWRVEAGFSHSGSDNERDDFQYGHFNAVNAALTVPVRVAFSEINATRPGRIEVFDNNNNPVDVTNIDNYRITTANEIPFTIKSVIESAHLNVRRQLNGLSFPAALQAGGLRQVRTQDTRERTATWNYNGPDGNVATLDDHGARPLAMQVYVNQDSHYGFTNVPWVSSSRAFAAWRANPALFTQTPAQMVAEEISRLTGSEYLKETGTSGFLQAEASLFQNRLKVVTGVRYERTDGEGRGMRFDPNAVFVRNANGTFARNAQGARIRKPEAGAAASMAEVMLTRQERAAAASRSYDGYYPSLHFTYNVKEGFLTRLAYARTYGRPNFTDIIPNVTINENDLNENQLADPSAIRGTLTARNPSLRPWTADNYDLSLEYYTNQGGLFSAGVFAKEIKNFFGDDVRIATAEDLEAVGLDPSYVGWNLSTQFNSGDARILGAEFNFRHSLRNLGQWGSYFTVFGNATKLKLEGDQKASFASFIPTSGNWGVSFNRKRLSLTTRWNYRGQDERSPQPNFGPDGYEYYKARTTLDLSASFQLTRRLAFVASLNNVLNVRQQLLRYGSSTPGYARQFQESEYGTAIAVGVKGSF